MILLSLVSLQLFTVQSDEADWLPAHTHTHTVKEKTNWGNVTMARVTTEDFLCFLFQPTVAADVLRGNEKLPSMRVKQKSCSCGL